MNWWKRWYYTLRSIRSHCAQLNRRAEVEQVLFNVANGKRPTLSPEECRALAMKLGDPCYGKKS
jgi:hypothetical protein